MKQVKVLFVCMGNICRSPTAHAVFRHLVKENSLSKVIEVDSAGTHSYHIGNKPDKRSMQVAEARGIEMRDLQARKVDASDFIYYDYILAMDGENYAILKDLSPPEFHSKIRLFLEFAPNCSQSEVPEPYYGGVRGFDNVFDMIQEASIGLLSAIKLEHML